ncbi:ABC transporter permease [Niallia sp. 01092]|uniref:ABC transporter permease n=1 Tax=unclassified Niallia TaxID=2837522 RepID=UPI003FD2CB8D
MRLSDYFKLGGNNFLRNGFKTLSPIIIITIGIIVFNVVTGFFSSITTSMNTTVIDNDSLKFIEVVPTPEKELTMDDFHEMNKINGVITSYPKVQAFVGLEYGVNRVSTNLVGVNNKAVRYFTSGKDESIKNNEIILNSNIVDTLKPGDSVNISYTVKVKEGEGIRKIKKGKILSFFNQFYLANYPEDLSLATLDYVEQLNAEFLGLSLADYRKNLVYEFGTVIVDDVENISHVAEQIESLGYDTSYALKSSQSIPMVAKIIITVGGVVLVILLLFSGISIASIMGQSLRGRYKEIGIMRAVGYERSHLIKLFSVEVLYISLISFFASITLSFIIIQGLESYLNKTSGIKYIFSINMTGMQVIVSFVLIIIVSFLASFRPIIKASSTDITEIIRGNAS